MAARIVSSGLESSALASRALASRALSVALALVLALAGACRSTPSEPSPRADAVASAPEVTPPFAVRPGAQDLLLAWYDAKGEAHTASAIDDVPAAERARVRVDSLAVAPEQRLDPDHVYVADLRTARPDGSFSVRKVERAAYEASALPAAPEPPATIAAAPTGKDIVLYGASWCGACKQARRYFQQKGLAFVDHDIEHEPEARKEMLAKARAQGVSTSGIPVIDVRGRLMGGFDPSAIESALAPN
jgi:glutaredoxin